MKAQPGTLPAVGSNDGRPSRDASIGHILGHDRALGPDALERIASHQRDSGLRFGEAAVALGLADEADVASALAHQFRYPWAAARAGGHGFELVVMGQPFSPQAEAFRGLRAQLKMRLRELGDAAPVAVAVTSPSRGDGRSYCAANLAVACSQLGGRTLLIDADLRRPRQHAIFGIAEAGGLAHMLAGRSESLSVEAVPGLPSLFVLPVGAVPPNPLELLEGAGLARLLADIRGKFEHVIVDTPALSQGGEGQVMDGPVVAAACGAALLVLRRGETALAQAQDLAAALMAGGARTVGAVFNQPLRSR